MTLIIGMENRHGALLACDSQYHLGNLYGTLHPDDAKIVQLGEMYIGLAGQLHDIQLIRFHLCLPAPVENDYRTVINTVEAIRQLLKERERYQVGTDRPPSAWSEALIAYRGHIYEVNGDLTVARSNKLFTAIGSGAQVAIGFMEARRGSIEHSPRIARIARETLAAASRHAICVAPPFIIREV